MSYLGRIATAVVGAGIKRDTTARSARPETEVSTLEVVTYQQTRAVEIVWQVANGEIRHGHALVYAVDVQHRITAVAQNLEQLVRIAVNCFSPAIAVSAGRHGKVEVAIGRGVNADPVVQRVNLKDGFVVVVIYLQRAVRVGLGLEEGVAALDTVTRRVELQRRLRCLRRWRKC